jgi:fructokinase
MQKTILSFGETLWDLFPTGPMLGGAPFNLAYRVNSLGDRGMIITRLGRDDYGHQALEQMATLGMDASHVQRDDFQPSGTVGVTVDASGNPDFAIVPNVAFDFIDVTFESLELAGTADCFCFGTLVQRSPTARLSLSRLLGVTGHKPKFLDINLRKDCYSWETINESLKQATILKMNEDETRIVAWALDIPMAPLPELCQSIIGRCSLACCLVTLGARGAFAVSADGNKAYVPGYEVRVVDTCGSGDAFSAAFIHEYLRGKSLAECCRLGNALGAMVALRPGATTPVSLEEVRHLLKTEQQRVHEPSLKAFGVS